MNEMRSKMRAELYHLLEDNIIEKPQVSQENLLLNELIREYMEFNSYRYSKSVFLKGKQLDRNGQYSMQSYFIKNFFTILNF